MAHDHLIAQLDQLQQQFGESHALLLADERQVLLVREPMCFSPRRV